MQNDTMYSKKEYYQDLDYCGQFIYSYGSNYSLGTRLFKKDIREATIFFYAFVRYADELVDNPESLMKGQTHGNLDEFLSEYTAVVNGGASSERHPVIRALYYTFITYNIPFSYTDDFLEAMKQDITKSRYQNYQELEKYMWGSAAIVGHVMTYIVGYKTKKAFKHAKALGEAMQLANFLRDVDEDYRDRDRIYLPQDEMASFGVTDGMIAERVMTAELRRLIQHYVDRAEKLFAIGMEGIPLLENGGFSVLLASRMYRENIMILKKRNYDIFEKKIKISGTRKLWLLFTTVNIYLKRK